MAGFESNLKPFSFDICFAMSYTRGFVMRHNGNILKTSRSAPLTGLTSRFLRFQPPGYSSTTKSILPKVNWDFFLALVTRSMRTTTLHQRQVLVQAAFGTGIRRPNSSPLCSDSSRPDTECFTSTT